MTMSEPVLNAASVTALYAEARNLRDPWEALWQDCYDYALPTRHLRGGTQRSWRQAYQHLYDATANDAVDQLAACLLSQLVPPWSPWVEISAGPALSADDAKNLAPILKQMNATLHDQLRHSNFTVELHQALLDMVTVGTACVWVGAAPPGRLSALHFQTLPLSQFYAAGTDLQHVFMPFTWPLSKLRLHFPAVVLADGVKRRDTDLVSGVYAVINSDMAYHQCVMLDPDSPQAEIVWQEHTNVSPFIAFRWQKTAGEIYGRSPVMKALPDIKTANKVVELVLKNASIAVTGIWQADDDGVLNPANIKLTPGTIIPKAVGSSGLTPLKMPGNFDLSQLVLNDLRQRIKQALLADRLALPADRRMTATEILERNADMVRALSAVYNRLQGELLVPLVQNIVQILGSRGDMPEISLNGQDFTLNFLSPLGRAQAQDDVQATLSWLSAAQQFGPEATAALNVPDLMQWLGRQLGVPSHLLEHRPAPPVVPVLPVLPTVPEMLR